MNHREREPTRDELYAMAYFDGELAADARAEFERRMANEPALGREVAELQRLAVIARRTVPPEPMDHEWARLEGQLLHGGGSAMGFLLATVGAVGLGGFGVYSLLASEAGLVPKIFGSLLIGGLALVFLLTLRARLRTLPYDPYTEVER